MNNWMEEFERRKNEQIERKLNIKLDEMLDLLDETYKEKDRIKVIEKIIMIYEKLRIEACDYDEKDYMYKKQELTTIKSKMKKQEYMESLEAQSWNEYKEEEQIEEDNER